MKKADRVCAYINLDALENNVNEIRRVIKNDTMLMCVIKADGYGHGAKKMAMELDKMGADWFAVATADEGVELRNSGVEKPILILGFTYPDQYDDLIKYNITPTVITYENAKELSDYAASKGAVLDIHVKLDTGMSRIGIMVNHQTVDILMEMSKLENVRIQGIFTHFACADELDKSITYRQIEKYNKVIGELEERGIHIPIKHASNSAGIMQFPEANMNMVRAGIILYGLYPSEDVDKNILHFQPVMELKSHVAYMKEIDAGTGISYGLTYVTKRRSKIATVTVGYGDGYPRQLSNRGRVLIKGQSAPIVGRICMDQFMVDITDLDEVCEGDEVTLVGRDGDEFISVEEVAGMVGSFNYEFVCVIGRRIPRVYLRNNKPVEMINYLRQ